MVFLVAMVAFLEALLAVFSSVFISSSMAFLAFGSSPSRTSAIVAGSRSGAVAAPYSSRRKVSRDHSVRGAPMWIASGWIASRRISRWCSVGRSGRIACRRVSMRSRWVSSRRPLRRIGLRWVALRWVALWRVSLRRGVALGGVALWRRLVTLRGVTLRRVALRRVALRWGIRHY